jgi:hypothetical protein
MVMAGARICAMEVGAKTAAPSSANTMIGNLDML